MACSDGGTLCDSCASKVPTLSTLCDWSSLSLPFILGTTRMQPLEKHLASRNRLERILIIDDDPVFLRLYRNLLVTHESSYELVECTDGYAALGRMLERTPRLVLLDLAMPRFDGGGFLKIVKSKPELGSLPIFVISSDAHEARRRIGELDHVRWFAKPIRLQTLRQVLAIELGNAVGELDDTRDGGARSAARDFDPDQLSNYVGRDRVVQLATAHQFCALAAERLAMLARLVDAADRQGIRALAHVLEGSAATLGAATLLTEARRLRAALDGGQGDESVRRHALAMSAALQRFTVALAQHFNLNDF